jgi:hypothetical protein
LGAAFSVTSSAVAVTWTSMSQERATRPVK